MHDNRPKILIADDDPEMLSLLVDVLEPDGYKLLLAQDVQGAIQLAVAHEPELMLLDVVMPDGGGYAICRELNERAPEQRPVVIFLTGLDQPEQMQHAFSLGAADYITKPFSIALLRTRVRTWLVRLGRLGPGDASITASPPAADPSQPPVS